MLDQLDRTLREGGSRPALLGSTRSGTPRVLARCAELTDRADRFAAALHHRHGLRPGDTLGIAVRPGPRALAVLLAAHRLGLRTAVLDPAAGPDVLRARLALAPPALILADAAAQAVAGWARPLTRRAHLELPPLHTLAPSPPSARATPAAPAPSATTRPRRPPRTTATATR
ncbi:AMP-binding protein [Kitasatospora cheerisanensis]|uniref:AMP-dependent synthetase/ligase domain-containing protein n=1 Tax=Kitasatospora cheerisanensis KCTC 2395 TaxID=1348663 RepID=A0A066YW99_9ACTN|nr:AMP-binding protein [Kitasatospora cheerisanensis]KDN84239.1 hypothetical protein KCH_40300 [Kitasatospora cheerisanensis KCTC 2395]